jgi:RimJ/RimL family protein N-acetyltransferase
MTAAATHLTTERLTLRPIEHRDEASVVATLNDFEVTRWLATVPFPYSANDFWHFLHHIAAPGHDYVIEDADGFCGLVGLDDGREIGYWLTPRAQGKGYATEAVAAVLTAAFARDKRAVQSGYFEGNQRSANVLRKLGFVETARTMETCVAQGVALAHVTLHLDHDGFQQPGGQQRAAGDGA